MSRILALVAATSASHDIKYNQNGRDWPNLDLGNELNMCGSSNQSPINLIMPENYGDIYYS